MSRYNHYGFFFNWIIIFILYYFKIYTFEFAFYLTIVLGIFWSIAAIDDLKGDKK